MILLRKNHQNQFVVTLSELKDANLPSNWLFVFTCDQSEEYVRKVYLTDIAPLNQNRFNLFNLNEPTDVQFPFIGDYKYEAYQMPNGGSTDESIGLLVEVGKMRVLDETDNLPTFVNTFNPEIYGENIIS